MKSYQIILTLLILILLTSCAVYRPQLADIPLINHKNDLRIAGGVSTLTMSHATISYGVTENLAVQAFGSARSNDNYFYHGAIGYFKDLGDKKIIETYLGAGAGYGECSVGFIFSDDMFGPYKLYFAQLNYGEINATPGVDYGFGLKIGYMRTNFTEIHVYDAPEYKPRIKIYDDKNLLLEPVFSVRFGGEHLKFDVKLGNSLVFRFPKRAYQQNEFLTVGNLGFGVNYTF